MSHPARVLRLATRGSPLALIQARIVEDLVKQAAVRDGAPEPAVELVVARTRGDENKHAPIHSVGGQGIFVKEVDAAVLDGRADAAVHSCKDLPASSANGGDDLAIVAVPPRADPRDALVGRALDDLFPGAVVATGSVRRRSQLAWLRPDLMFRELRGNMSTRLSSVPERGSVVVAMAALDRLGCAERASEVLSVATMLPQVGQGAIAVTGRPGDELSASLLAPIDHAPSHIAIEAERAFLRAVGGGCDIPVGAHAVVAGDGSVDLEAVTASLDGHILIRRRASGLDPGAVGAELASQLLDGAGGRFLLAPGWEVVPHGATEPT